jgi:hypothetical protein
VGTLRRWLHPEYRGYANRQVVARTRIRLTEELHAKSLVPAPAANKDLVGLLRSLQDPIPNLLDETASVARIFRVLRFGASDSRFANELFRRAHKVNIDDGID